MGCVHQWLMFTLSLYKKPALFSLSSAGVYWKHFSAQNQSRSSVWVFSSAFSSHLLFLDVQSIVFLVVYFQGEFQREGAGELTCCQRLHVGRQGGRPQEVRAKISASLQNNHWCDILVSKFFMVETFQTHFLVPEDGLEAKAISTPIQKFWFHVCQHLSVTFTHTLTHFPSYSKITAWEKDPQNNFWSSSFTLNLTIYRNSQT